MKHTYSTSQTAEIIGIHPNTVRLYEELGLITPPERKPNGYRILRICISASSVSPGWPFRLRCFRTD